MLIDLTEPFGLHCKYVAEKQEKFLPSKWCDYTGVIYTYTLEGMCSTYIDFPGHIKECEDGQGADNYPIEKLYRQEALVLHLNHPSGYGAVTDEELTALAGHPSCECLVINGLTSGLNPWDVEQRSVWLDRSALDWIIATGCHLLVSDIYEKQEILGVFKVLFDAGICTVCEPWYLWKLPGRVKISSICLPLTGARQLPCRLIAEF